MSVTITHKKVTLDQAISRGKESVTEVTLRKPKAGELRGLSLSDLLNLDVNAISTVLPRISSPMITKDEVLNMDPADLVQIGGEISNFLVPKKLQLDSQSESDVQASLSA
ncbi:phage tail protein [Shewanella sp. BC20]|uniref:phage tail assembly protein n=1 Tax=Shewanella TaxID=22 RepID=UPI000D65B181|nr:MULTISPECIES: phage tail assembly protein [Shewanella]PWF64920.1 phage tail protein [Shewanella sp. BC20]UML92136.1 phage tail assembly protein [Shewanella xiamenensis]